MIELEASLDRRYAVVSPDTPALLGCYQFGAGDGGGGVGLAVPQDHYVICGHDCFFGQDFGVIM